MKRVFFVLLAVLICLTVPAFAEDEIKVTVNGEALNFDVPPCSVPVYNEGNYVGERIMLPVRAICEKLNADVYWDAEKQGITVYRKDNMYLMWVGEDTAFHLENLALKNGYSMDVAPTIIDSRTLVPVRAVSELLGAEVNWIGETKTVEIKYALGSYEENSGIAEQCNIYQQILNEKYEYYRSYITGNPKTINGRIVLESGKEIEFELYPELAPVTSMNFVRLAENGFYNGTVFHRVINGFMAQGGGFFENGEIKQAEKIKGEFIANGFLNLLPHKRGVISLARANDFNSGSSQFFIMHKDSSHLDGYYAAFGMVTKGMEVIDEICASDTDFNDKPLEDIIVRKIEID